jgi:hypothetical protein
MNPLSTISIVTAASLLTSCASTAGQPKPQSSQNSGQFTPKRTPTQEQRDYAAQTAASVPSESSSVPTRPSKAAPHVTQSTQVEKVIGSKPVIGDDSELRN